MALPSFIPLLASLLLLFPPATPSDLPPPAPNISVVPPKPRFLVGDAVSIVCAAPGADPVRGFRFSGASGWVTDVRTSRRTFGLTFVIAGPRDAGAHTCSYSVFRRGRGDVHSLVSAAALIDVRDRPTQPNLTVTPSSVTVEGQPLVFSCAAPPGAAERRFGFFQEEQEVEGGVLEGSGARLRVERSERNRTGNFSCRYEEMTEGRWIASYRSEAVPVLVEGRCPAPVLSVEPPSGSVPAGQPLLLRCAAPPRRFRRRFRFLRHGRAVGDVIGDVSGEGAELLFPRVSRDSGGNFSCLMEEEVGGAWVEAPPSRGVAVVVRAQFEFLPLVIGGVVGVALLLLGLLLAAWLCRRRRGGSRWRGLSPGDDTGTIPMGDYEGTS